MALFLNQKYLNSAMFIVCTYFDTIQYELNLISQSLDCGESVLLVMLEIGLSDCPCIFIDNSTGIFRRGPLGHAPTDAKFF